MNTLQVLLFLAAIPIGAAYVCRLALLDIKSHKPAIVLLHVFWALAVAWAGYHAFKLNADLGHAGAVLGAACWIRISYATWRKKVPQYFESRPQTLEPIDLTRVHGRGE